MPEVMRRLAERLPLEFRVLYGQFMARVVDLEALSIEADIPRFIAQFAGVLILIDAFRTLGFLFFGQPLLVEQSFLSGTMLIAGLGAVATWDNIFPDRRDAMVLGPLPVKPRTILAAKLAASGSLLGVGVLALNLGIGIALPLVAGIGWGFLRALAAYWIAAAGAAVFVYGAVLTVQGLTAALLPQRWNLRLSAILQLAAFALFLSAWLFQPKFGSLSGLVRAQHDGILNRWPAFWFFALFAQVSGAFPFAPPELARRAWMALAGVLFGMMVSLLLCYKRTMKRNVEEPDLVPRKSSRGWMISVGDSVQTAVVQFSMRSLARSRQHRVIYAFFLAIAFAVAVSTVTGVAASHHVQPVTSGFLMSTLVMLCLAVLGLRSIFSLPVSLKANWVLQVTQLSPSEHYIATARRAMLAMATGPVWLTAAALALFYRPWHQVAEHLLVLALAGSIITDLSLIGVSKIPFACSYLPGKSNVQYVFWAYALVFVPLALSFSSYEKSLLDRPLAFTGLVAELLAAALGLWLFNRHQAKSAVLYYEELEPEVITTLGIGSWQPPNSETTQAGKLAAAPPLEAQRQTPDLFGVVTLREEYDRQRPAFSIGTVLQDLRYAVRGIIARRWFSAAIIVTLALGIGLNTMGFTLVYAGLYKTVPVPNGARLVTIENRSLVRNDPTMPMSYPDFEEYRSQSANLFEFFEAGSNDGGILSENGLPPQAYPMQHATGGFFSMIDAEPILGRAFLPSDEKPGAPPVLVISYNVWKERYAGSREVIGRHVQVNGQPATMIGVMPDGFHFPVNSDLWIPLAHSPELSNRDHRTLWGYGILKRGVTLRQANAALNGIAARLRKHFPDDNDLGASVLTFQQRFNGGPVRILFLLLLGAVGFVLLIACADVANMMLSRSLGRQREMAIRTALGATRWRIVRQLLIESVLLSTAGGIAGLGLAAAGVHWLDLASSGRRPYWIEFTMNYPVFGYFAALCIVSGLLCGIAPALRSSKAELTDVLKEGVHSAGRRRGGRLSAGLVVFQFALTLVLLTGAGIFMRSLYRSLTINPFVPEKQLTMAWLQLPESRYKDSDARMRFYDQLVARLRAIPGVSHAAIVSNAPAGGAGQQQIELEHAPIANPASRPWISEIDVSPGYLDMIHLPLLRGRDFNTTDGAADHQAAIVTREAATRLWPGQDPIGKRFRLFDERNQPTAWITVVGISANIVQDIRTSDPMPLLFLPYRQESGSGATLMVESAVDPVESMRKAVASLDPELPLIQPDRLDEEISREVWILSLLGKIFLGFALIAMLMAAVGIYAVIAHATSSRTQEIGVRIALGATKRNILMLVMRRGLWQIGCALLLGLGAALPVAHVMTLIPIGGVRSEPAILLAVAVLLASVGVFACWIPARRASSLDPVKAIRYE
jgi:putative ABC transport system permease protein